MFNSLLGRMQEKLVLPSAFRHPTTEDDDCPNKEDKECRKSTEERGSSPEFRQNGQYTWKEIPYSQVALMNVTCKISQESIVWCLKI